MTSSPRCFQGPLWPLISREAQKDCGPMGAGPFHPPPSVRPVRTPTTACGCSTLRQLWRELASFCPSSQPLSHLLTPGGQSSSSGGQPPQCPDSFTHSKSTYEGADPELDCRNADFCPEEAHSLVRGTEGKLGRVDYELV